MQHKLTDPILQSLIPVVMSGIIAVYGLVVAVLISQALNPTSNLSLYTYDIDNPGLGEDWRLTQRI